MKRNIVWGLVLSLGLLLTGCEQQKELKKSGFYLNTIFEAQVKVENKKEVIIREARNLSAAFDRLVELDVNINKLSPLSEISALNAHAGVRLVELSKLTYDLIEKSLYASSFTDGYFDITWQALVKIFETTTPSPERLVRAKAALGPQNISLDRSLRRVRYLSNNTEIDFEHIKTGFAVDLICGQLKSVTGGQVKAGNLGYYYGSKRLVFKVSEKQNVVVKVADAAVIALDVTDSYYARSAAWRRHLPVVSPLEPIQQIIVVAPNAVTAEVLANAFYFMGVERSLQKINAIKKQASRQSLYEVYFVLAGDDALQIISSADKIN